MLLTAERVRWWAIAVIAAMPTTVPARLKLVTGPFQILRLAAMGLYQVCPEYATSCRDSIHTLANVLKTIVDYVQAGCPCQLVFTPETMPNPDRPMTARGPLSMRGLVLLRGHRRVFLEIRNGLWELLDLLRIFQASAIDGAEAVLHDVISFSEDVLYMCKALCHTSYAPNDLEQTPHTLD